VDQVENEERADERSHILYSGVCDGMDGMVVVVTTRDSGVECTTTLVRFLFQDSRETTHGCQVQGERSMSEGQGVAGEPSNPNPNPRSRLLL